MRWRLEGGIILLGIMGVFLVRCHQTTDIGPIPADTSAVAVDFVLPKAVADATTLTKAVLFVTAADMDTIREELNITGMGAIKATLHVPAGKDRIFHATIYENTLAVLEGQETINITSGKHIELKMTLHFLVPAISLSPIDTTVTRNTLFTVNLIVHHVDSLCTMGCKLLFDPTKVQVVDMSRDDDFLKANGGTIAQLQFTRDNVVGEVKLVLGIFPSAKAVSGSGRVAHIVFKAVEGPNANLRLDLDSSADTDLGLYDKSANLMYAVGLGSRILIN